MTQHLISALVYLLLWIAVDIKRKPDSKVALFSKVWWLQLILLVTAVIIVKETA